MAKKIIIGLGIATLALMFITLGIRTATLEPHYYDGNIITKTLTGLRSCQGDYAHPFQAKLKQVDKPFQNGEATGAHQFCSFSPYYFITFEITLALATILGVITYWTLGWWIYQKEISKKKPWKKILFWITVVWCFGCPFLVWVLYWVLTMDIGTNAFMWLLYSLLQS